MIKKNVNILFALCLLVLIMALGLIRRKDSLSINYYQLNNTFYLHKLDYFSSYAISKEGNRASQEIITNVKDIAINHDSIIVRYMKENNIHYILLRNDRSFIQEINEANSIDSIVSNFKFMKPWRIVEQSTLNNKSKLISQLIIISIIIIGFYLLMQVFNIKKLSKRS